MKIEIPGPPIPLKRARVDPRGFYDPQYQAKQNLVWYLKSTYPGIEVTDEPLKVRFEFYMSIAKSWSKKKKREALGNVHTSTPDLSNLIKFYEDAFNGVLWKDDAQIVEIVASKIYALEPKTIISVITLD